MLRVRPGVRTRVLAIALVPSLSLLVVGVGATSYLVSESNRTREWAVEIREATPSTRAMVESVQAERLATIAQLTGDSANATGLRAARAELDVALRGLDEARSSIGAVDPALADDVGGIDVLVGYLTAVRTATDAGQLPLADAYNFFGQILDAVVVGSQLSQRLAPDAEIGVELAEGMQLLKTTEAMARSNAFAIALESGQDTLTVPVQEFARQVGYYRTETAALVRDIDPEQSAAARAITGSAAWQTLDAVEKVIGMRALARITQGTESGARGTLPPLPVPVAEWQAAAAQVNRQLIDLWIAQSTESQLLAESKAESDSRSALLAGIGVGAISLLATATSVVLADRIIRRLRRLRSATLELADSRLPEMMRKLEDGRPVDPAAESPRLDFGSDEIGQVAQAFGHAAGAAVHAAVAEARTREGVKSVFLNIAHRSQAVVHRQLEILDEAERGQENPALLETLFRLDHLATRERRNAENLIILGGGQVGRQWRHPVAMIDVVRSAVGETLDYSRVRVARMPRVHVLGDSVADLVHLLAELVDNATAFSPPQSRVEVTGEVVGRGVVVEIEDQGMGMPTGEIVRTNTMLADPPDFGVAALSGDSRLGLFVVARLAVRHDIAVKLAESVYGGIRAVVLIPAGLLAAAVAEQLPTAYVRESMAERNAVEETTTFRLLPDPEPREYERVPPDDRPRLPERHPREHRNPDLEVPAGGAEHPHLTPAQARGMISAIENGTRRGRTSDTYTEGPR
ncbi:nitrate- and nitrite sensing domain-containing protein [Nocardia sp. NPDC057227]|uniref:nitrate- and nitrite sensing domain-containing protein n=1 Tax=Nocardia sp. NPDC057227 TaxID=3346056 RepID=UPI003645AABA